MNNLKNLGINLRTLTPTDYGQFIEDLNYNFLQILNVSGFKGAKGDSIKGDDGIGIRGSKWIFINYNDFSDVLESVNDLTLEYINEYFRNDADGFQERLLIADGSDLVYGDTLVLPSGEVTQLISSDEGDVFIDTGISFEQFSSLTTQEVIRLIQEQMGSLGNNQGFRYYNAVAKNVSDASPSQNQNITQDSIIDIVVTDSGSGAIVDKHLFYAPQETQITKDFAIMQIVGSAKRYHELIQGTQIDFNNDYGSGVDDFGSLTLLQNSYKNGLIFGHKNNNNFRGFARLYKSETTTILTSSYSPLKREYSELNLTDNDIVLRTQRLIDLQSNELKFVGDYLNTKTLEQTLVNNKIHLNIGLKNVVNFKTTLIYFDNFKSSDFLTTDSSGKLIKRYKNATELSGIETDIINAKVLKTYTDNNDEKVRVLRVDVDKLLNEDREQYFKQNNGVVTDSSAENLRDLNNYRTLGITTFKITNENTISNKPWYFNDNLQRVIKFNLNVYTDKNKTNINDNFYVQELDLYVTQGTQTIERSYKRFGTLVNGVVSWFTWKETVVGHGALSGDEIITRNENTLNHKKFEKNREVVDAFPNENVYVYKVERDEHGHIIKEYYKSFDTTANNVPSGTVLFIASRTIPKGYLYCDGTWLNCVRFPNLYRAIGGTFGYSVNNYAWDTNNNEKDFWIGRVEGWGNYEQFRLPDLRGKFIRGWNNSTSGYDANRAFGSEQRDTLQFHKHAVAGAGEQMVGKTQEERNRAFPFGFLGVLDRVNGGYNSAQPRGNFGYLGSFDYDNPMQLTSDGRNETNVTISPYGGNPNPDGQVGTETRPRNIALTPIIKI